MAKTKTKISIVSGIFIMSLFLMQVAKADTPPGISNPFDNPPPPANTTNNTNNATNNNTTNPANTQQNPPSPTVKISDVTVFPAGFNPTIENTKISYTTSQEALINLTITDSSGQLVATLVNNQDMKAGKHFTKWAGNRGNIDATIIAPGTYNYKIVAKNIKTNNIEDSKDGTISLIYTPGTTTVDTARSNDQKINQQQITATLTLNNTKKGKTAKTGPDVLIYGLFPLAGYLITRKKK